MSNPFEDPSVKAASYEPASSVPMATPVVPASPARGSIPPTSLPPTNQVAVPIAGSPAPHENLMEEMGSSIKKTNSSTILRVMQLGNVVLAAGTITAGVMSWIAGHVTDFQTFIASTYIILFGFLLLGFELRTDRLDEIMRHNFGFMYGYKTRTIFLLFIAIWPLSMGGYWLTILDAVLLFLNAFFNFFVVYHHPAFSGDAPPEYQPTTLPKLPFRPGSPTAVVQPSNNVV
ncbi:hypothetical protein SDRG_00694 [Saprolegnia diclina VS20]|uniref:Uncharacterized protein n=1 Tax=Saprolegnia diclina (strain VS20) TaxID=1156394 RepID=T0R5X6_SAPDV|nr:hypothetical protein SDRG_00694 [Saprolegnia diclina VS20]EQC41835.1 hypothetical protein SDRG_00694 [Saprolegnia diclina VS20]|eukprot:XP_008604404.1 hypothetical protein SDRG_00694 [Saprolegnia diclina VS20]